MDPVPDVDDLTSLFGAEPVSIFEDDWRTYWPYSTIRFSTIVDEYEIELEIEPGADTAKVRVGRDGGPLIDLDLRDVATVMVDRTPDTRPNEALRIVFRHAERLSTMHLRLKPSPWMVWRVDA